MVVEVGVTVLVTPLVMIPIPLSTEPVPLTNTAVSVVEPPKTIVSDPGVKLLIKGAGTTDRVKLWTASLPTPLWAVKVRLYVPSLPAAGVPLSSPVEALNVTPLGNVPLSNKDGAGNPATVTVNDPGALTVSAALLGL